MSSCLLLQVLQHRKHIYFHKSCPRIKMFIFLIHETENGADILTQQHAIVNKRRPTAHATAIRIMASNERSPESYLDLCLEASSPARST